MDTSAPENVMQSNAHVSFGIYDILKNTKTKDINNNNKTSSPEQGISEGRDERIETTQEASDINDKDYKDGNNNELLEEEKETNGQGKGEPPDDALTEEDRKKKTRTVFSRRQVFQLESTFESKRYLSSSERVHLAETLELTETQVCITNWRGVEMYNQRWNTSF